MLSAGKLLASLKAQYLKILVYSIAFGFFIFTAYRFFGYSLINDDWILLANRPSVWTSASHIWETWFRPMGAVSYYYSNLLFGNQVYWHYYLDIALVLTIGFLLYSILNLFTKNGLLSSIIAVVIVVGPYAAHGYSWISQRYELLYIMFYLASYYLFLRFFFLKWRPAASLMLSFICFLLALLSKEMAITLPFAILLTVLVYSSSQKLINLRPARRQILSVLPYFVLLAGFMLIRAQFVGNVFGPRTVHGISYSAPILLQAAALFYQYSKAVLFSFMPLTMFFSIGEVIGWTLLVIFNLVLFYQLKNRELCQDQKRNILFLALCVLIVSVPLIRGGARQLFMSSLPLLILMGYNVYSLIEKYRWKSALRGLAIIILVAPLIYYSINVQNLYHPGTRWVIEQQISRYNESSSDEEKERMKVVYFNRYPEYFSVSDDRVTYHNTEYEYNGNESEIVRNFVEGFLKKRGLWERLF